MNEFKNFWGVKGIDVKKILVLAVLTLALSACSSTAVRIDQDQIGQVKKVAVVVFALKKSIEYRDEPTEDDSEEPDVGADTEQDG